MKNGKTIHDLNLLDRFLFAQAASDIEFVEIILSIILDTEITLTDSPQPEKEFRTKLDFKQIRLDVMATDTDGSVYDAEVQKRNTDNLPKRMRYYHSMIDTTQLPPGKAGYDELNDVFVILIAPFDLFGKGLYKYTFKMHCEEALELGLNDGVTTIFLNTRGTDRTGASDELIELLNYFEHSESAPVKPDGTRIRTIREKVDNIRRDEGIGMRYLQEYREKIIEREEARKEGLEEGWKEGIEKGIKQGIEQGKLEAARVMLTDNVPVSKISMYTGLTEAQIAEVSSLAVE